MQATVSLQRLGTERGAGAAETGALQDGHVGDLSQPAPDGPPGASTDCHLAAGLV